MQPALCAARTPTELARLEHYIARNVFSWRRDDARVEAAGKVTLFGDKVATTAEGATATTARDIDAAHAFVQPTSGNQLAAPVSVAAFNGQLACLWNGAQEYYSTLALAQWARFHNGSPFTVYVPFYFNSTAARSALFATTLGTTPGVITFGYVPGATMNAQILKAAGASAGFQVNAGAVTVSTPYYFRLTGSTALGVQLYRDATQVASTALATATAADPGSTMYVGSIGGLTYGMLGYLPEHIFATRVDATLDAAIARYFLLRYAR
jgi:hypothetical protein